MQINRALWSDADGNPILTIQLHAALDLWVCFQSDKRATFGWLRRELAGYPILELREGETILGEVETGGPLEIVDRRGALIVRVDPSTHNDFAVTPMYSIVDSLAEVQQHVNTPIIMPDLSNATYEEVEELVRVASVLRGDVCETPWKDLVMSITDGSARSWTGFAFARNIEVRRMMTAHLATLSVQLEAREKLTFGGTLIHTSTNGARFNFTSVNLDGQPVRSQLTPDTERGPDIFIDWLNIRRHPVAAFRLVVRASRSGIDVREIVSRKRR